MTTCQIVANPTQTSSLFLSPTFAIRPCLLLHSTTQDAVQRTRWHLNRPARCLLACTGRRCYRLQAPRFHTFLWLDFHPRPLRGTHSRRLLPASNIPEADKRLVRGYHYPRHHWTFSLTPRNARAIVKMVTHPLLRNQFAIY